MRSALTAGLGGLTFVVATLLWAAMAPTAVSVDVPSPVPVIFDEPELGPIEDVVPVTPAPRLAVKRGIASWMPEKYGRHYLALPGGPGARVRICGAGGCWTATSMDAGPDRAMQRQGRIADLAVVMWERVCGVPRAIGLCSVSIVYLDSGGTND